MPSSKNSKHYTANSTRTRRHSGDSHERAIVKRGSKHHKDKDTDSDSGSSSSTSTVSKVEEKKCPMRVLLLGLFDPEPGDEGKKGNGCPLRRVQLWHTIPLCLLAIINLMLVILALLGLAGYKIAIVIRDVVVNFIKPELGYGEDEMLGSEQGVFVVAGAGSL